MEGKSCGGGWFCGCDSGDGGLFVVWTKCVRDRVGTVFEMIYDFGVWGFSLPFSIRVGWCHSSEG